QKAAPLEILVADVKRSQRDDHGQRPAAETRQRGDDLFQLTAEQRTDEDETPCIKQRTQSIEEEESRGAYARTARQGRCQSAQTRNEFRRHDPSHPVSREEILRPTNARVRLQ